MSLNKTLLALALGLALTACTNKDQAASAATDAKESAADATQAAADAQAAAANAAGTPTADAAAILILTVYGACSIEESAGI